MVLTTPITTLVVASGIFTSLFAYQAPVNVQEIRQKAEERREAAYSEFQERQEEARKTAEEKRQEFMEKVQQIRDEQKRRLAEKLSENISGVNQKWVNHWLRVLDNLTQVLVKMESRADKLESLGHDVSEARAKIQEAYNAIAAAQAVLNEQAGKIYTVEFTDENDLGSGIRAAIEQLRVDLRATREEVQKAIIATKGALSSLREASSEEAPERRGGESEETRETEESKTNIEIQR